MLQQTVFDKSWRVLIIEEHDRRLVGTAGPHDETRWQDYAAVVQGLRRIPFEVVVAKPLVESDRAVELMDAAVPVRAIWMLRRYDAVSRSNIKKFGVENPYRDLRPFCESDPLDWRRRGARPKRPVTPSSSLMGEGLSPLDAGALFWWARNRLYFDQHLQTDDRIRCSVTSEPATNPKRWSTHSPPTPVSPCPPAPSPPKCVRQPERPEAEDLHPGVQRLCRKTWESFGGCPEL